MNPILTTITPYWGRPDQLLTWVRAIIGASIPEVIHFVYFIGEDPPDWWKSEVDGTLIIALVKQEKPGNSIGYYHNLGASNTATEWIMKFDVDALPNVRYFKELVPILQRARSREWFNGGMFFMSQASSKINLIPERMPLDVEAYSRIMSRLPSHVYCSTRAHYPQATNFICRRQEYLDLGGCDARFQGWGWEDYQQIFMLEKHWLGKDPLSGLLNASNVTQRCRDQISRPKALRLWKHSYWLCLLHCYHPANLDPIYKDKTQVAQNKAVLLDYINSYKK